MTDNETLKMLRAVINGQSALREEFLIGSKKIREDIANVDEKLTKRIDKLDTKLTERIDKIGASVAFLEDDSPTLKQHNKLEKRVTVLETNFQTS